MEVTSDNRFGHSCGELCPEAGATSQFEDFFPTHLPAEVFNDWLQLGHGIRIVISHRCVVDLGPSIVIVLHLFDHQSHSLVKVFRRSQEMVVII